ncbi:hypothetical protein HI914_05202 [Erysiphe necator]|nr:hypothetical protein HI914_05202 [Erysiphe necator]
MKSIIITLYFYLITHVVAPAPPVSTQPNQETSVKVKSFLPSSQMTKVNGVRCGEQFYRSEKINEVSRVACQRLKYFRLPHHYPQRYQPLEGSQPAITQVPGQKYYIYPINYPSILKRISKLFRPSENSHFIVLNKNCELQGVFRIKERKPDDCKGCSFYPSQSKVEKLCKEKTWLTSLPNSNSQRTLTYGKPLIRLFM